MMRSRLLEPEALQHLGRTALPLGDEGVALILEILDPHLAAPEARGGEVTEVGEEAGAGLHLGPCLLRPGDVVQDRPARGVVALHEGLVEAVCALVVQPGQPAAHRGLPTLPLSLGLERIHHDEVHELGHAGVRRAARALVLRDHDVRQHPHRLVLVGGEELGDEGLALRRLGGLAGLCDGSRSWHEPGERHGTDDLEQSASTDLAHRLPFFRSSAMCSAVLHASARIVQVGFLSALLTNGPPSATNRFGTSWAWHHWFSTDVLGLSPMRVVPPSWIISPPTVIPYPASFPGMGSKGVPPIFSIRSRQVSCTWRICLSSWSDHLKWKRSTGMPHLSTTSGSISQ